MSKGMMGEVGKALGRFMFRSDLFLTAAAALCLGSAALLGGCLGGSDGVENPKLELEFRPDDGTAAVAGRVSL